MALLVQSGPFRFCTKANLDAVREQFTAAAPAFNDRLISSSVNGNSFSFGGRDYTREEFGDMLAAAYCTLGEYKYGIPQSNRAAIRFS